MGIFVQFFVPMMENSENTMDSNDTGIFIISLEKNPYFMPRWFLEVQLFKFRLVVQQTLVGDERAISTSK